MSERIFLDWSSTKQELMRLAQGHNAVMPVGLEPATPRSRVKHSSTEPLRSVTLIYGLAQNTNINKKWPTTCWLWNIDKT